MQTLRPLALALLVAVAPTMAAAQAAPITIQNPIDLSDQVNADNFNQLRGPKKILVPTALVRFATRGSLTVVNQGRFFQTGGGTARAKGKFIVAGLEKAYVQDLARQLQDDFIARLRAMGHTVLTYDDVKQHEEVLKMGRYQPDNDWGMPTGGPRGSKNTYLMAFPSDTQAIDPPFQGYGWGFRKVTKDLDAIVVVPEYIIDSPLLGGSRRHGVSSRSANVSISADMTMFAFFPFHTAKGGWGSFGLKGPFGDLGEDVGTIGDATDDSPRVANALASGLAQLTSLGGDMQTRTGTWGMRIDRAKYAEAVLRGGVSVNMEFARRAQEEFGRR